MKTVVIVAFMISGTMVAAEQQPTQQQQEQQSVDSQLPVINFWQGLAQAQSHTSSWWSSSWQQIQQFIAEVIDDNQPIDGDSDATPAPPAATTQATTTTADAPQRTSLFACMAPTGGARHALQILALHDRVENRLASTDSAEQRVTEQQQQPVPEQMATVTAAVQQQTSSVTTADAQPIVFDTTGLTIQQVALLQQFADQIRRQDQSKK